MERVGDVRQTGWGAQWGVPLNGNRCRSGQMTAPPNGFVTKTVAQTATLPCGNWQGYFLGGEIGMIVPFFLV